MATEKNLEKLSVDQGAPLLSAEKPFSQENKIERGAPRVSSGQEKPGAESQVSQPKATIIPFAPQSYQQKRAQAIDNILAEGLNEVFLKMNPVEQKKFKAMGEETVVKINKLLDQTKVKVNKIISLIKKWLKLIPRVNHFFLEQEAKIKADKIIKIKNKL